MIDEPRLVSASTERLSPWVSVVTRVVAWCDSDPQSYHSITQADYVNVLALTDGGQIPLVRQFRPAMERVTLELPGGIIDTLEEPAAVGARELFDETGFRACGAPVLLGNLTPDTGRLENRFWCFFVRAEEVPGWHAEAHVERVLFSRAQLRDAILDGSFDHALHIALINLALMRGCFRWDD